MYLLIVPTVFRPHPYIVAPTGAIVVDFIFV